MTDLAQHSPEDKPTRRLVVPLVLALLAAGLAGLGAYLAFGGSSGGSTDEEEAQPAVVEPTGTHGVSRVVLSQSAAERLNVQTAPVTSVRLNRMVRGAIPYTAVIYDTNGDAWTYTSPEPLVYVRQDLEVVRVRGGEAILARGPPTGTSVVTVGQVELWGVEYGEIEED
jgi:hypothetical protein